MVRYIALIALSVIFAANHFMTMVILNSRVKARYQIYDNDDKNESRLREDIRMKKNV